MKQCATRRRENKAWYVETPGQVVVGRCLVRSKSSQKLLGVCSDANSTAGVGQDLGNSCQMPDPCADKNLMKIQICLMTVWTKTWEIFADLDVWTELAQI